MTDIGEEWFETHYRSKDELIKALQSIQKTTDFADTDKWAKGWNMCLHQVIKIVRKAEWDD